MRGPLAAQSFDVVVGGRPLGTVTQLPSGAWLAELRSGYGVGSYASPVQARQAVIDRSGGRGGRPNG